MRKKLLPLMITYLCTMGLSAQVSTTAPTWSSDVACIIYSHCSSCHNPASIAPFSLLTYQDAYLNMQSIKNDVKIKKMPPYLPNTSYQHYGDMRTLTPQEIRTIEAWVDSGGRQGDTTLMLPQPVFTTSTFLTHPDITARIPNYVVPNTGADLYRCFVLTGPQDSARYIKTLEVIPGDRSAVHHVLVYEDTAYSLVVADSLDPAPGYTNFGGTGSSTSTLIGGWVPGSGVDSLPTGMGIKLNHGMRLIIQIHYPTGAQGKLDSTRINIQYTPGNTVRDVNVFPILNHRVSMTDGPLVIPQDSVLTFHEQSNISTDLTLLSIAPHAHLVCTKMKAYCVNPAGDTIPLVDIDRWDFHWQGAHYFQRPIKIPAGSTLYGQSVYDNTYNNPESPRPIATVSLGEATTNEMMLFFFSYLTYHPGDENIIIDTNSHQAHYEGCMSPYVSSSINTGIAAIAFDPSFNISPNPALASIQYQSQKEITSLSIIDISGQIIHQANNEGTQGELSISELSTGLYFIRIQNNDGSIHTLRFVKE